MNKHKINTNYLASSHPHQDVPSCLYFGGWGGITGGLGLELSSIFGDWWWEGLLGLELSGVGGRRGGITGSLGLELSGTGGSVKDAC